MKAVLNSLENEKWLKAMEEEYKQHQFEYTWGPVTTVWSGAPFIPTHIVLVRERFQEARLVAGGHRQGS